ncbi:MAG: enoyl-CoA hydratase/isomerase family protein [Deltaproteobacteria bacterium]|nr:enoyl-CoA hydratase/isomerase family protein [Deltaproteobacteria bacterium]
MTVKVEERGGGIYIVTLDRPAAKNALTEAMIDGLHDALGNLVKQNARGLVITGAGDKAFASGADIAELKSRSRRDAWRRINSTLFAKLERFPAPTVAAINGFALGGGLELALACDLRVCSDTAKLGQPEVSLGIIPGAGATYRLPRLIGVGRAKDMILTARIVEATEALQMGLVNRVVPAAKVLAAAVELVEQCAVHSAPALRLAKEAIDTHGFGSFDAAMAFESTAQAVLFDDPEKHARMQAFLDRKAAK